MRSLPRAAQVYVGAVVLAALRRTGVCRNRLTLPWGYVGLLAVLFLRLRVDRHRRSRPGQPRGVRQLPGRAWRRCSCSDPGARLWCARRLRSNGRSAARCHRLSERSTEHSSPSARSLPDSPTTSYRVTPSPGSPSASISGRACCHDDRDLGVHGRQHVPLGSGDPTVLGCADGRCLVARPREDRRSRTSATASSVCSWRCSGRVGVGPIAAASWSCCRWSSPAGPLRSTASSRTPMTPRSAPSSRPWRPRTSTPAATASGWPRPRS